MTTQCYIILHQMKVETDKVSRNIHTYRYTMLSDNAEDVWGCEVMQV